MHAFLAIVQISFRCQLTYRAANLSGLFTNLMFGFFRAAVLIALYQEQTVVNGLSIRSVITYRIRDLEVRDQPIEDTIREIYEDKLLYNQTYEPENSSS